MVFGFKLKSNIDPKPSHDSQKKDIAPSDLEELKEKAISFFKLTVVRDRPHLYGTYRSSFVGHDTVDSMIASGLVESRKQAILLGQDLVDYLDLFQDCSKNKKGTTRFEDKTNKFYSFSTGVSLIIDEINHREICEAENDSKQSVIYDDDSSTRGPGLLRQNNARDMKYNKYEDDDETVEEYHEEEELNDDNDDETCQSYIHHYTANKTNQKQTYKETNPKRPMLGRMAQINEDRKEEFDAVSIDHFDNPTKSRSKILTHYVTKQKMTAPTIGAVDNSHISKTAITMADRIGRRAAAPQPSIEKKSEERQIPTFVTSPKELPARLLRQPSETSDALGFLSKKRPENLLASMGNSDDQSIFTEYVIQDEEGRERYRQNIERRGSSEESVGFSVNFDRSIAYEDDTIYENVTVASAWQPSVAFSPAGSQSKDDQSCMEFTVFDQSVDTSVYIEDQEDYVAPKPKPQPKPKPPLRIPPMLRPTLVQAPAPEQELELVRDTKHVSAQLMNGFIVNDDNMDDDVTAITMDQTFMFKTKMGPRNNMTHVSSDLSPEASESSLSSRKCIEDLYSPDIPTVLSALQQALGIVVSEHEQRKEFVVFGGINGIMTTMEKHLDEESIQYYACLTLEILASVEPDAQILVDQTRLIILVAQSLEHQVDSERVQQAGNAALATMCKGPSSG